MPLRRIDEEEWNEWGRPYLCRHPEHNLPNMIVLPPGLYEHECPSCGAKQRFRVPERPQLSSPPFPLRVYDHRNQPIGWTTDKPAWYDS